MTVARTAARRRKQMLMDKRYKKKDAAAATKRLQAQIAKERAIAQRGKKK